MMRRSAVDQLLEQGEVLKKAGDFISAKNLFFKAVEMDPSNSATFMKLGKIAHLLKDQGLALRCYAAAMHLQITPIEKFIIDNQLPCHLKIQQDAFSDGFLDSLPRASAFIIYVYPNTPRHTAHSLIDLSDIQLRENPQLLPFAEIYHSFISKNGTHPHVLQKYQKSTDDQIQYDGSYYIPIGRNYLMKEIEWGKIHSDDVLHIYF
ncbi:hypothetical protein HHO41_00460 [Bacillus sp. DNRA2]|uniref:tetratricopeptide repeat protein n=1 Tax=Bacillus sp. DNRA2 TaxID=2723053 RepID=UPI00145CE1E6|nr:hypothetical protein [Bacillus sp. DNRA2]NMD68740.1 hypothetical protein [Bacillus sp. DNRA2]